MTGKLTKEETYQMMKAWFKAREDGSWPVIVEVRDSPNAAPKTVRVWEADIEVIV